MKEASLGFDGRRAQGLGDAGIESRLGKGLLRLVAVGTPWSRLAGWLVGG